MAFVETARWQIETPRDSRALPAILPAWASGRRGRQILGIVLALAVHLVLALVLIDLMVRAASTPSRDQAALTVLTLAPPGMQPDAMPRQQPPMPQATRPVTAPSPPQPQIPVEWSISRLRVAVASPTPEPVAAPMPPMAAVSQGSTGVGPGGSGSYDPYAGASPQRQADRTVLAATAPFTGRNGSMAGAALGRSVNGDAVIVWGEATVAAIAKVMARRFSDTHGPIRITLRLPSGRSQAEVEDIAGPVGNKALAFLKRLLAQVPVRHDIRQQGFSGSVTLIL